MPSSRWDFSKHLDWIFPPVSLFSPTSASVEGQECCWCAFHRCTLRVFFCNVETFDRVSSRCKLIHRVEKDTLFTLCLSVGHQWACQWWMLQAGSAGMETETFNLLSVRRPNAEWNMKAVKRDKRRWGVELRGGGGGGNRHNLHNRLRKAKHAGQELCEVRAGKASPHEDRTRRNIGRGENRKYTQQHMTHERHSPAQAKRPHSDMQIPSLLCSLSNHRFIRSVNVTGIFREQIQSLAVTRNVSLMILIKTFMKPYLHALNKILIHKSTFVLALRV